MLDRVGNWGKGQNHRFVAPSFALVCMSTAYNWAGEITPHLTKWGSKATCIWFNARLSEIDKVYLQNLEKEKINMGFTCAKSPECLWIEQNP